MGKKVEDIDRPIYYFYIDNKNRRLGYFNVRLNCSNYCLASSSAGHAFFCKTTENSCLVRSNEFHRPIYAKNITDILTSISEKIRKEGSNSTIPSIITHITFATGPIRITEDDKLLFNYFISQSHGL